MSHPICVAWCVATCHDAWIMQQYHRHFCHFLLKVRTDWTKKKTHMMKMLHVGCSMNGACFGKIKAFESWFIKTKCECPRVCNVAQLLSPSIKEHIKLMQWGVVERLNNMFIWYESWSLYQVCKVLHVSRSSSHLPIKNGDIKLVRELLTFTWMPIFFSNYDKNRIKK